MAGPFEKRFSAKLDRCKREGFKGNTPLCVKLAKSWLRERNLIPLKNDKEGGFSVIPLKIYALCMRAFF